MSNQNEIWARKLIQRLDVSYRPRWELFDELVHNYSGKPKICLNLGSGIREETEYSDIFGTIIDSDIKMPLHQSLRRIPFVCSDLYKLPFRNDSFDTVLLRFVVEHLEYPPEAFREIHRILKKSGKVIIITTNLFSPIIALAKLLPYPIRKNLMKLCYGVDEEDVFPTFHRINTKNSLKKLGPDFKIREWMYHQDANWHRRWLFLFLFAIHLKTKWLGLPFLRTNFLTVLEKN
jgi:SAM-dependent methyltransferase